MSPGAIVIVHGPMGAGKTRHGEALRAHYGCARIVDDWNGRTPLRAGDLALTTMAPPFRAVNGAAVIVVDVAAALMRLGRRRASR